MEALDKAIQLIDVMFNKTNGSAHFSKHKEEFPGVTKKQYLTQAKEATETKQGKGEIQYKRMDGSLVRYNLKTNVMTVWYPKEEVIATHFKPKFNSKTGTVNKKESLEYVRNDMRKNGKKPNF